MSFEIPRHRQPVEAWKFALAAHKGQGYGVLPMAFHLKGVAVALWELGYRQPEVQAAAPLHDTLEDTKTKEKDLWAAGFSAVVVRGVVAVSLIPGEPFGDYIARVKSDPVGHAVKMGDGLHNRKSAYENAHLYLNPDDALKDQVKYDNLVNILSDGLPTPADIDDWTAGLQSRRAYDCDSDAVEIRGILTAGPPIPHPQAL